MDGNSTWENYRGLAGHQGAGEPAKLYNLLTVEDLASQPPQAYRIKSVFPETGIAAIFGPSTSGKSFLCFDMAGAIAGRVDWFGYRVRSGHVVYVCLEGESGLRNRVAAYRSEHGGASLANVRFIVEPFGLLNGDPFALIRAIKAVPMECPTILIDTLNRAAPGADENSSVDMGLIIESCKLIQAETGGLVVLVHHTGKDAQKGPRGHSSLIAALDAAVLVTRDGDHREIKLVKVKDGQDGMSHGFRLKVITLGEDEDGDPVTSCVVEPVDCQGEGGKKPKKPLGGNQKIAWAWLSEEFKSRAAIPIDEAVGEIAKRLSVSPDRRLERARESITGLINNGSLSLLDGVLSCPVCFPEPRTT